MADIERAVGFYCDVLGFEVQQRWGDQAAFVSAGGYHHHLAVNVWQGRGVGPAPEHTAGLRRWTVQLPTDDDVAAVQARIQGGGRAVEPIAGGFLVRDPWQIPLAVVSTAATGLRSAATVATAKPSPYLLQTAKHFRHKLDVRFDEREAIVPFTFGYAVLRPGGDGRLRIDAFSGTEPGLRRVERVIGEHLERFGRGDGLVVAFEDGSSR